MEDIEVVFALLTIPHNLRMISAGTQPTFCLRWRGLMSISKLLSTQTEACVILGKESLTLVRTPIPSFLFTFLEKQRKDKNCY